MESTQRSESTDPNTSDGTTIHAFALSVRDQVLMTSMKLKLNRVIANIGRQFHVSQNLASSGISYWIAQMEKVLHSLIVWHPMETIQAIMPASFQQNSPNVTCVIDCNESSLQKLKHLDS